MLSSNKLENKLEKLNRKEQQTFSKNEVIKLGKKLIRLKSRNRNVNHINYKLYHLLCDPFTFINAYCNISKNIGSLKKKINNEETTISSFSLKIANQISTQFKQNTYSWSSTQPVPKPGKKKKMRPIDTPTQKDRIVQEAIRNILECIFEPEFKELEDNNNYLSTNFGFRENKSTYDAINHLKINGQGTNYAIKGDIKGAYNNINHEILLKIISKRIKDKKFLNTIEKLLKFGIMYENKLSENSFGQGGIVSPLLFNIYMFELDKHILNNIIIPLSSNNKKRKKNNEYERIYNKSRNIIKNLKIERENKNYQNVKKLKSELKILLRKRSSIPSKSLDSLPNKNLFVRYVNDWILLSRCNLNEANLIKENIQKFISSRLFLELDSEKILITNITHGFNFLGFTIKMYSTKQNRWKSVNIKYKEKTIRTKKLTTSRKLLIYPDKNRLLDNLKYRKFCDKNYFPIHVSKWIALKPYEIVTIYRDIMIGIFNYYSKCDRDNILYRVSYILQYSCAKTLAARKRCSIAKIFKLHGTNLQIQIELYKDSQILNKKTKLILYPQYKNNSVNNYIQRKFITYDPFK